MSSNKPAAQVPEKIKSLLSDLGKPTKRGVRKCPVCGTMNGTRGLACKNSHCEFVFMESRRRREKNVEAVKIVTGQPTQLFSVRLRDRGADYRGLVQLPQVQDSHGNPAENIDPAVLLPVLQGTAKCFVDHCSRSVNVPSVSPAGQQLNVGPPCQHIKAAIECKEEARALRLKNSVLNALQEDQETRNAIWNLATNTTGPLVQRVTQNVMVVKCAPTAKHPLGFMHFTFHPPAKPKPTCDYSSKFQCSNKDCRNPKSDEASRKHNCCLHFYACVCSFASDDTLMEEFAPFIALVSFADSSYERLRMESGMVTQSSAFMESLQLAEDDLAVTQGEEGTEESLVVESLDQQQTFHIVSQPDGASGHDVITTVAGEITQISPTASIVSVIQPTDYIIDSDSGIPQSGSTSHELESTIRDSMTATSDAITSANMIVTDDVITAGGVITSGDIITSDDVMQAKNVVITVHEDGTTRHEMLHIPTSLSSTGDVIDNDEITKRLLSTSDVIMEADSMAEEGVNDVTFVNTGHHEQHENIEVLVEGDDETHTVITDNHSIIRSGNQQTISDQPTQYLTATTQSQQQNMVDSEQILNTSTDNAELIAEDDDQPVMLDTVQDTGFDNESTIVSSESADAVMEGDAPSVKRVKLALLSSQPADKMAQAVSSLLDVQESGAAAGSQEVVVEPQVFTMASELLKKQASSQNRYSFVVKNTPKKGVSDEAAVNQSFLQWLSSVTERINQTMHYQFSGSPDPLVFHAPQVFFDCLQARISAGSKKKRLPNHTSGFVRRDALPLGTFTKYTWYITNILHVKQIFDTSEVSVDITRSFIENRDGTFDYNEKSAHEKGYANDGKNLPIRPFELKTYLKVGMTSPNQKEATPFVIEWIPDILPKSHIGELRIKFEYGHQRNGHLEDRSGMINTVYRP